MSSVFGQNPLRKTFLFLFQGEVVFSAERAPQKVINPFLCLQVIVITPEVVPLSPTGLSMSQPRLETLVKSQISR